MTDVMAHRGASQAERENTVDAFRRAVQIGADGIELDVRRTADGVLVVHHDARLPGGSVIAETPAADLPVHVPTLRDALDACAGAWVNVEIKNDPADPDFDADDTIADAVVALLRRRAEPAGSWLISSFRLATIDRCRELAPDIPTAWLTIDAPADAADVLADRGHAALHPWFPMVTAELVARLHAVGCRVNVWTCNDPASARRLASWGVDGICTDVPDEILAALGTDGG